MALLENFMIKQTFANEDLELQADSGESLLVHDILVMNPVADYASVFIDKDLVGYFRTGGNLGNHLGMSGGSVSHSHGVTIVAADGALTEDHAITNAFGVANATVALTSDVSALTTIADLIQFGDIANLSYWTILRWMRQRGIFTGFPIADGEKMVIQDVAQADCWQAIVYQKFETGDQVATQPNGSQALEYSFVNYGRPSAALVASGDQLYDVQQTPVQFPKFPFGAVVPSNHQIEVHGILASDIVDDRGSNDTMNSDYLKLIKDRTTLFDEDKNGIFLKGIIGTTDISAQIGRGYSLSGQYSDKDQKPPIMFDPPLVFNEGDELNVNMVTTAGSSQSASDLAVADVEIGIIEKVIKTA